MKLDVLAAALAIATSPGNIRANTEYQEKQRLEHANAMAKKQKVREQIRARRKKKEQE